MRRLDAIQSDEAVAVMLEAIQYDIVRCNEVLEEFHGKFAEDSYKAFDWGEQAIAKAAMRDVYLSLRKIVEKNGAIRAIEIVTKQALEGARWPHTSTSTMSNLLSRYRTEAYARFADDWCERVLESL